MPFSRKIALLVPMQTSHSHACVEVSMTMLSWMVPLHISFGFHFLRWSLHKMLADRSNELRFGLFPAFKSPLESCLQGYPHTPFGFHSLRWCALEMITDSSLTLRYGLIPAFTSPLRDSFLWSFPHIPLRFIPCVEVSLKCLLTALTALKSYVTASPLRLSLHW